MELFEVLSHTSIAGLLSLVICMLPLGVAILYVVSPTEARLAVLRPVSLASIFAALAGAILGIINVLRVFAISDPPEPTRLIAIGIAESLVPPLLAFACLTVAWLCVAGGLRRQL